MSNRRKQMRQAAKEAALRASVETANALARAVIADVRQSQDPSNRNPDAEQSAGWKFLGFTPAQLITFVALAGFSALTNYISGNPRILYFSVFTFFIWLGWVFLKSKWMRIALIVACIIAEFVTHIFVSLKLVSIIPEISVDTVAPPLAPKDPFGIRFVLESHSPDKIYDLSFDAWWNDHDPKNPGRRSIFVIGMTDEVAELGPFMKFNLRIWPKYVHPPMSGYTTMTIAPRFTTKESKRITNYFRFKSDRTSDGDYIWLPQGPGEPLEQLAQRINKMFPGPKMPQECVPFIDVKIISISTNGIGNSNAVGITFTDQNIGGATANNIDFQWFFTKALNDGGLAILQFTNGSHDPFETVVPGATETNRGSIHFPTNIPAGSVYEQLMSGDLFILGDIRFRGASPRNVLVPTNAFENTLLVTYTNAQFVVHYIGFSGDFNKYGITNWPPGTNILDSSQMDSSQWK
jgi:hypothetical protein